MKRLAVVLIFCLMLFPSFVYALGTWSTTTYENIPNANMRTVTLTWVADAIAATVPNYSFTATDLAFVKGWYLYSVETDPGPGATAPTPAYDITILDAHSMDLMGGELADRSDSDTEWEYPKPNTTAYLFPFLDGSAITVTVSNNVVVSATGVIKIFLAR